MKKIYLILMILFLASACRKSDDVTNIYYVNNSQLWINVDDLVTDFTITFTSQDAKNVEQKNIITYKDKVITPTLKTREVINNGVREKWILVHTDFDKTDQITVTYNGTNYVTSGYDYQEKRLIYIKKNISGEINITDADITILESVVYVN